MPLKHPHLRDAYRLMRLRGITHASLAAQVMTGRAYVSRVLGGYERAGRTWQRLKAVLPPDIVALLEAVPPPVGARKPRVWSMKPRAIEKRRERGRPLPGDLAYPTLRAAVAALPGCGPQPDPTLDHLGRRSTGLGPYAHPDCPVSRDEAQCRAGINQVGERRVPAQVVADFHAWKQRKSA